MPELPEIGETIVCKITKVLDYGVFVDLQEYEGVQGFVHISQVSSSWVKNIRNFVKEGQIRAAKVVHRDSTKNQIDLSFNKVPANAQRKKIEEWRQSKRAQKLIEIIAKNKKEDSEKAWEEIAEPLLQNYDSLFEAFQAILLEGDAAAKGVPQKWLKPLKEVIQKNVEIPRRTVRGTLTLTSYAPNGAELIKKSLISARDSNKDAEVDIYYVGSGKYAVNVTAHDYKLGEKVMGRVAEKAIELIKSSRGTGEFEKAG